MPKFDFNKVALKRPYLRTRLQGCFCRLNPFKAGSLNLEENTHAKCDFNKVAKQLVCGRNN